MQAKTKDTQETVAVPAMPERDVYGEVLYIRGSQLGTSLEVSYRRNHGKLIQKLLGGPFSWMGPSEYPEGRGVRLWTSPLY